MSDQPKEKEKRRSIRGRRSSIQVKVGQNSTVEVNAPSEFDTVSESIAFSLRKKEDILKYTSQVQKEREEWDAYLEATTKKTQKAERMIDVPLASSGCPRGAHAGADGRKARNVMQRVLTSFRKHNQNSHLQHESDKMEAELRELKLKVEERERRIKRFDGYLNCQPEDELHRLMEYFDQQLETEARRAKQLAMFDKLLSF